MIDLMKEKPSNVAKRLDRCADRLLHTGRIDASLEARKLARVVSKFRSSARAHEAELEFLRTVGASAEIFRAVSPSTFEMSAATEYDPGTLQGQKISEIATSVAQDYENRDVTYQMGGDASAGGDTSDCSHFVHDVLQQAGINVPYTTTGDMAKSPNFTAIPPDQVRPGDVIVQGDHMGIYTKTVNGIVNGMQMGDHGAQDAKWGSGGWFKNAGDLRFYRPKSGT